jgi:hypothetical protein
MKTTATMSARAAKLRRATPQRAGAALGGRNMAPCMTLPRWKPVAGGVASAARIICSFNWVLRSALAPAVPPYFSWPAVAARERKRVTVSTRCSQGTLGSFGLSPSAGVFLASPTTSARLHPPVAGMMCWSAGRFTPTELPRNLALGTSGAWKRH